MKTILIKFLLWLTDYPRDRVKLEREVYRTETAIRYAQYCLTQNGCSVNIILQGACSGIKLQVVDVDKNVLFEQDNIHHITRLSGRIEEIIEKVCNSGLKQEINREGLERDFKVR